MFPSLKILSDRPPYVAEIVFPRAFVGFSGHFPEGERGGPILPGFVQLALAGELLKAVGVTGWLRGVEVGKFIQPILPEQRVRMTIRPVADDSQHFFWAEAAVVRGDADLTVVGTFQFVWQ